MSDIIQTGVLLLSRSDLNCTVEVGRPIEYLKSSDFSLGDIERIKFAGVAMFIDTDGKTLIIKNRWGSGGLVIKV